MSISLSLSASLSLTPFSLLRLDHQQRRRVKFSTPFSSSFSASALSAPVLLGHSSVFLAVHPVPSQLTSCTRLFFPPTPFFLPLFTMEQLCLKRDQINACRCKLIFCGVSQKKSICPKKHQHNLDSEKAIGDATKRH